MALLVMILRKMSKNKWLELSLLLGLVISVALVSCMPIYTEAVLQRMLVKDLENMQETTGQYPGTHTASVFMSEDIKEEQRAGHVNQIDDYIEKVAIPDFSLPVKTFVKERSTDSYNFAPLEKDKIDSSLRRVANFAAYSGLQDNIRLVDGKLPAKEPVDGVYEALVTSSMLAKFRMVVGNVFVVEDNMAKNKIKVKPVGVIDRKPGSELYWFKNFPSMYEMSFILDFDLFEKEFTTAKTLPIRNTAWNLTLDYSKMDLRTVNSFIHTSARTEGFIIGQFGSTTITAPALNTISTYFDREAQLRKMLWSLNVPVMIMLAFYLFMVANLIAERQKTEIAVLRSRGASRMQIMMSYVVEGVILGVIAFLIGPFIGAALTRVLGSSNGFLEFVQRTSLDVHIGADAYKYAFYAVVCSLVMTLIPAFLATRASIVGHKQQMARQLKMSFWHKFFIDVILVGISIYELNAFNKQRLDFTKLGFDGSNISVDPMLFLVPALFILGLGLIILRVYPYFIRFVYWIGRKWWPPYLYSTLIQVGRSSTQYQFLMIFLIITIATGIFGASAARTINQNIEDKISYKNGTDLVMKVLWQSDAPSAVGPPGGPPGGAAPAPGTPAKRVQYSEPPFQPYRELPGVEHAAKVFVKPDAAFSIGKDNGQATLMGIDTDEFARTAWMRDGLLDHHFYDYLNLLSSNPNAVLVSRTIAESKNLKAGDEISVQWKGVDARKFVIYGIVDYWPTFNPNPEAPAADNRKPQLPYLIIGHLDYIQNALALEPYEIWLKLKAGAERQDLIDSYTTKKMPVTYLLDTRQELINAKKDPFTLAINGLMTLGFIISVMISFIGFLLYWVLSLSGRTLQLGILRAMGISFLQLMGMLVTEQVLTSGAAIAIGLTTGIVTSQQFVKLFQLSFNPATQVPPFKIILDPNDSVQLFIIVTLMVIIGLFILGYLLSRIKIHQAVKLGED